LTYVKQLPTQTSFAPKSHQRRGVKSLTGVVGQVVDLVRFPGVIRQLVGVQLRRRPRINPGLVVQHLPDLRVGEFGQQKPVRSYVAETVELLLELNVLGFGIQPEPVLNRCLAVQSHNC
jgi:hypothetical protein